MQLCIAIQVASGCRELRLLECLEFILPVIGTMYEKIHQSQRIFHEEGNRKSRLPLFDVSFPSLTEIVTDDLPPQYAS